MQERLELRRWLVERRRHLARLELRRHGQPSVAAWQAAIVGGG
jgi:hypothetical protein